MPDYVIKLLAKIADFVSDSVVPAMAVMAIVLWVIALLVLWP
jgi:hypothetical protein